MIISNVSQCRIIELDKIQNRAGNLTVVHNQLSVPFNIERIYYLYDVPTNSERGGHAHKELYQLIIASSGSFKISVDDASQKTSFLLNNPNKGLLVIPGIWRDLSDFSSGSVCLVLASMKYTELDYIRDYQEFLNYKK